MALREQGPHRYGDSQEDIRECLLIYGSHGDYPLDDFAEAVCQCGCRIFQLLIDENEGVAVRVCKACSVQQPMGDSEEYLPEAILDECECLCGSGDFELTAGVSLYRDSKSVHWFYIGARCPKCGLTACYADWKNEHEDYEQLLNRI